MPSNTFQRPRAHWCRSSRHGTHSLQFLSILFSPHTLSWGSTFTQNYTFSFKAFEMKPSKPQNIKVFTKLLLCSLDKEALFKPFCCMIVKINQYCRHSGRSCQKAENHLKANKKLLTVVKWYIRFLDVGLQPYKPFRQYQLRHSSQFSKISEFTS